MLLQDEGFEDCQRCGKVGIFILCYSTHLKLFQCLYCGLSYIRRNLIDRKKSTKKREYYKLDKKGEFVKRRFIKRYYGAYYIKGKNGIAEWGGLTEDPRDEKVISRFRKDLESPDVDASRSYLTRWDEVGKEVIFLIGTPEITLRILGEAIEPFQYAEHFESPEVPDDLDEIPF